MPSSPENDSIGVTLILLNGNRCDCGVSQKRSQAHDIWGAQQLRTGCLSILMFLAPLAEVTP